MITTFVTGSDQLDLAVNIGSDISVGLLDLTIYSVTPDIIGSDLDNLILNLSLLQALRFSDVNDLQDGAFLLANFSDLQILSGDFSSISGTYAFYAAQMNTLTSLDLSSLTDISGFQVFSSAQINALTSLNLPLLSDISGDEIFDSTQMNVLTSLTLPSLTNISGNKTFYFAQMNALTSLNLPSLSDISGNSIFNSAQMNALTSLNWPSNLSAFSGDYTFYSVSVPNLPGICLGKTTTFHKTTFENITQGPSDMKELGLKTHSDIVYASDFYGYACLPLVFDTQVQTLNVFDQYTYQDYNGSDATNLTITAINEMLPPVTIDNITFQSDGTVTVNRFGPHTFTMRFSADGNLIGARSITINRPQVEGIVTAIYQGSLLNFSLILPPELVATLPITSDIHEIFSDMCTFAQAQQPCQNFLAGIIVNDYSDLFCSDAIIVQHPEVVVISCSDNVLHLDDDDGHFTLSITDYMSDTVSVHYDDILCHVSDVMYLSDGSFNFQPSDVNFVWVDPCDNSDVPNVLTTVFNHPLLAIDAEGDVVDIGLIDCSGPCRNPTSDLLYVSQIKSATLKLGQYLSANYSDYTSKISDQCHMLYLGPITAGIVTVDIEACRLIFNNLFIPFSDINICP